MAHVEEVEELEGKKSSFEDILVFFFFQRRSGKRPSAKDHSSSKLSFQFSSIFQFTQTVQYIPYLIVDLRLKNCLIERVYMLTIIFLTAFKKVENIRSK